MSKCLRCGAGAEWIQGRVNDGPQENVVELGSLRFVIHEDVNMPKDEVIVWQGERRYRFKFVDTGDSDRG